MFRRFHEKLKEREEGFTLIELLVVILIIAILAAIAIPVFLRQREKGWTSQMQSALKNSATALESYATENNGGYDGLTSIDDLAPGGAQDQGLNYSEDVTLVLTTGAVDEYCVDATHAQADDTWFIESEVGEPQEGTCATGPV